MLTANIIDKFKTTRRGYTTKPPQTNHSSKSQRINTINKLTEDHYWPHSWVWACACHGGGVVGSIWVAVVGGGGGGGNGVGILDLDCRDF